MFLEGIIIGYLTYFLSLPPLFPEKQKVKIFFLLAILHASIKFSLFPDVVKAMTTSPELPNASNCLEKIYLKPKSFPVAVIAETSVDKASPAIAFLFFFIFYS